MAKPRTINQWIRLIKQRPGLAEEAADALARSDPEFMRWIQERSGQVVGDRDWAEALQKSEKRTAKLFEGMERAQPFSGKGRPRQVATAGRTARQGRAPSGPVGEFLFAGMRENPPRAVVPRDTVADVLSKAEGRATAGPGQGGLPFGRAEGRRISRSIDDVLEPARRSGPGVLKRPTPQGKGLARVTRVPGTSSAARGGAGAGAGVAAAGGKRGLGGLLGGLGRGATKALGALGPVFVMMEGMRQLEESGGFDEESELGRQIFGETVAARGRGRTEGLVAMLRDQELDMVADLAEIQRGVGGGMSRELQEVIAGNEMVLAGLSKPPKRSLAEVLALRGLA